MDSRYHSNALGQAFHPRDDAAFVAADPNTIVFMPGSKVTVDGITLFTVTDNNECDWAPNGRLHFLNTVSKNEMRVAGNVVVPLTEQYSMVSGSGSKTPFNQSDKTKGCIGKYVWTGTEEGGVGYVPNLTPGIKDWILHTPPTDITFECVTTHLTVYHPGEHDQMLVFKCFDRDGDQIPPVSGSVTSFWLF